MGATKQLPGITVTASEARPNGLPAYRTTCTVVFTITNVNDNLPVFNPSTIEVTLPENTETTTVATFEAMDADDESMSSGAPK